MSVEIRRIDDGDTWNEYVEQSPEATVFHRKEILEVMAHHSGTTPHYLCGFKGEEPSGLFPLFDRTVGPLRVAFSPPPDLRVPYLGPVMLNHGKLKERKEERRRRRFVEGCLSWLDERRSPRYRHVRSSPGVTDVRPFKWNGWVVSPTYTYEVDLRRDPDELLKEFSRDARSNVTSVPNEVSIRVGDIDAASRIIDQVRDRFDEQGEHFELTNAFVADLGAAVPDDVFRPYVCQVDGDFAGGIVVLADDERFYRWQGGVRATDSAYPINDLLDWHIAKDAIEDERVGYDLVGAKNPRLSAYKSKFAPDLRTYFYMDGGSRVTNKLARMYDRIR